MRELLLGTGNKGKVTEILKALDGAPFTFLTLVDVDAGEVEETGSTLEENAVLKARTYGERTGKLTLADDSGLEVDALDGEPGVQSAYYAPGSDADRYNKLLRELKDVSDAERTAQFTSVIALYDPVTQKLRTCEGTASGHILREPKGMEGFGYDPVFFYDVAGKSGGEMSREEKNAVSHRGKALAEARKILLAEFI